MEKSCYEELFEVDFSTSAIASARNDKPENKKSTYLFCIWKLAKISYSMGRIRDGNETKYHINTLDIVSSTLSFPPHLVKTFLKIVHLLYS